MLLYVYYQIYYVNIFITIYIQKILEDDKLENQTAIVILNYNGWRDTTECLQSLLQNISDQDTIVIIDNKSTNDSVEQIENFMKENLIEYIKVKYNAENKLKTASKTKIVLICSDKNLGFSGGNNIGIDFATENNFNYILFLNNDTIVKSNFIKPSIELLNSNKQIGLVGAKIFDYYNTDSYILGGKISRYFVSGYHHHNTEEFNEKFTEFISGCYMLTKTSIINKIGRWDEKYFLYLEDVEICNRYSQFGYKIISTNKSQIYHKEGQSTTYKPIMYYYNTRNRLLLSSKILKSKFEFFRFGILFFASRIIIVIKKPSVFKFILLGFHDYINGKFGEYRDEY
ncbi:hypothetical protein AF59_08030 [Streptococcus uberis C5072]|nr:hypothetical protein AF59_08030 [Streptococcus uberis C5072]